MKKEWKEWRIGEKRMMRTYVIKKRLIDARDDGKEMCRVETIQGRNVWIDLDNPDPMYGYMLEGARNFWGMPNLKSECGWYFEFDDIVKIIRCK